MNILNVSKNRLLTAISLLSVALLASISCNKSTLYDIPDTTSFGGPGGTVGPGPNEVFIQGLAFYPASISVAAGTTITWTNKDVIAYTVTSSTSLFNSGSIAFRKTFMFTFSTAGTYSYFCSIYPSMVATVTVN